MPVQIKILEQYSAIKLEINDLEHRIKDHEKQIKLLEQETVCDMVKGSRSDLRYGTIKIEGIAQTEIDWHWNLIHERTVQLQNFKKKLEEMVYEVEAFIESIDDCTVRMIARYRFLDGNTWEKTARCIGIYYTGDYCRQAFNRYFKKECKENIE